MYSHEEGKRSQLWLMINPSRTGEAWKKQWRGTYPPPPTARSGLCVNQDRGQPGGAV